MQFKDTVGGNGMQPAVIAAIITGSASVVGVIVGKLIKDRKKDSKHWKQAFIKIMKHIEFWLMTPYWNLPID